MAADAAVVINYEAVPQVYLLSVARAPVAMRSANSSEQEACCQPGQHICSECGKHHTPLL
jgi:hypothetical protein